MQRKLSPFFKILILIITNFIIIGLLLFGFEIYLRQSDPFLQLPFDTSYYERHEMYYEALGAPKKPAGGRLTWGHPESVNKFLFRDQAFDAPKPRDVCRIVVLGDSFTWGKGVAQKERYTNLVEQRLNESFTGKTIEVTSLARSGAPTITERDWLRKYKDLLSPDLVVVGFVFNDPQPRRNNYRIEQVEFQQKYGDQIDAVLDFLIEIGLVQTAKTLETAIDNLTVKLGLIPPWEVGMQRVYDPASTEWRSFEEALSEIKQISDQLGLPTPIFTVLNHDKFLNYPTDHTVENSALPIYLQWYHQAQRTAERIGFRAYNHEQEFIEQLTKAEIPVNQLDNHPSAKAHQVYAAKLFDTIKNDIDQGTLCSGKSAHGAVPAVVAPLQTKRLMSVRVGNDIRFLGYAMEEVTSQSISLSLGWQALASIDESYRLSFRIVDSQGQTIVEKDALPCQGDCLTAFWPEDLMAFPQSDYVYWPTSEKVVPLLRSELPYDGNFEDIHTIEIPNQAGDYTLMLAIRDPSTGRNLAVYDELTQTKLDNELIPLGQLEVPFKFSGDRTQGDPP